MRNTRKFVLLPLKMLPIMKKLKSVDLTSSKTVKFRDQQSVRLCMRLSVQLIRKFMMLKMMLLTVSLNMKKSVKMLQ